MPNKIVGAPFVRKHCVQCGVMVSVTSSSELCKYCVADQVINQAKKVLNPPQTGSGVPQKSLEHICTKCDRPFKIVRSKDMCHPCYTGAKEKEQLHLFTVCVWEHGDGMRPTSTTIVLDVDEEQAVDNVVEKMGYTDVSKTSVEEIKGPYASGFIVYYHTFS